MKSRSHAVLALVCFLIVAVAGLTQMAAAQDIAHDVHGIVKHIDHGTKTMVVKAADGTEHTIKYTEKTTWKGTKDAGKGIKDGSEVTVHYTEKGGEKTADAVKATGKDVSKAVSK